jgi:DNA-binding transcriptional LysR family regulator
VELNHLQTFLAVYRTSNVTRAAESLNLSQPAVTAHLRALETELGRSLFVRLARGVSPTEFADQLAAEVGDPIAALQQTASGFGKRTDISTASISIGGPVDALSSVVLPALASAVARGLRIRTRTGLTPSLVSALADGELDLVIATTPTRHRSVELRPYFDEVLCLVGSPRLAAQLASRGRSDAGLIKRLADAPLVAFAENAPLVRRYWRMVFGVTTQPKPRLVIDDLRAIARLVQEESMWTVLPSYLCAQMIASGSIALLHEPKEPSLNTLYIATRRATTPTIEDVVQRLLRQAPSSLR